MRKFLCSLLLLATLPALAACDSGGSVRQTLGLNREAPDEFKVVSRPPLSLPPDYELRPPSADAPRSNAVPADRQARALVTGADDTLPTGATPTAVAPVSAHALSGPAETGFLQKIGAEHADPGIRETLYQDQQSVQEEKGEGWFGDSEEPEEGGVLVDAPAEADRIKEKQQSGETVTGEGAQTREDKAKSVIDQIF